MSSGAALSQPMENLFGACLEGPTLLNILIECCGRCRMNSGSRRECREYSLYAPEEAATSLTFGEVKSESELMSVHSTRA